MTSTSKLFKALVITESPDKKTYYREVTDRNLDSLPANDTLVRVGWSSLNYKDALSATGNKGVTRKYPHTPGIDAAGTVVSCVGGQFHPGDEVIVTSYDLGMNTSGGLGEFICVPWGWLVRKPRGLSLMETMVLGTAGFTAGLCLQKLFHNGITAASGEVLVTGASGGVGCLAVAMLAHLGYNVVAATGKPEQTGWLMRIGATSVVDRDTLNDNAKPIYSPRWAGVVDTVGGTILSNAIKSARQDGCVTACGLAQGAELNTTVFPFILRGVSLCGVDSSSTPMSARTGLWNVLSNAWKPSCLSDVVEEIPLAAVVDKIDLFLSGGVRGRIVVKH